MTDLEVVKYLVYNHLDWLKPYPDAPLELRVLLEASLGFIPLTEVERKD